MTYKFENITVLIVESSHAMFDLTKSVLNTFGVNRIHSAFGFDNGLSTFCKLNPDLVIIDWLSEPLNGLELTKKIRSDPASPNPFVPVILMSGYSVKRRVLTARDSGITSFLAKPFTAKMLYKRIEELIEFPRQFVKSEHYFGPDRRRPRTGEYSGPERRSEASAEQVSYDSRHPDEKIKDKDQNKRP
ncbi:MAG: response regulator [Pseudomonadota bacterium]